MLRTVQHPSELNLAPEERTIITIGKFDGLHPGHQALIRAAAEEAEARRREGMAVSSVVFAINSTQTTILSEQERRDMLEEMGIDILIECPLKPAFIRTGAEEFITGTLVGMLHVLKVITGEDFRFGYGRLGTGRMLAEYGEKLGFSAGTLPDVVVGGAKVSSSRIREAVSSGDMELAGALLGYPFFVTGEIIHGRQIGRTIGVPTANLITDFSKLLPPNGVYYTSSDVSGRSYFGVTNVGTKPTVDGHFIGIETYFFDCEEDLYGADLKVKLLHFARPERKFASLIELRKQITKDEEGARAYFAKKMIDE